MPKREFQVHYCCFPSRKFFANWQFENHVSVKRRPHRMFDYGDLIIFIWIRIFICSISSWLDGEKLTIDELKSKRDWWRQPKGKDILKQVFTFWLCIKQNKMVHFDSMLTWVYKESRLQEVFNSADLFWNPNESDLLCLFVWKCLSGKYRSINLSGGKKYLPFYPFVWKKYWSVC